AGVPVEYGSAGGANRAPVSVTVCLPRGRSESEAPRALPVPASLTVVLTGEAAARAARLYVSRARPAHAQSTLSLHPEPLAGHGCKCISDDVSQRPAGARHRAGAGASRARLGGVE